MTYKQFAFSIAMATSWSIICVLLAGIFSYRYIREKPMKYFFYFVCLVCVHEGLLNYTFAKKMNNWWIINIYAMIEYTFYSSLLYTLIYNKWVKRFIIL